MKKTFCLSLVFLALAGCSTEETADDVSTGENSAPELVLNSATASINEGESATFSFNVLDDNTSYENLTIKLLTESSKGAFTLDKASKTVSYRAPMMTEDKSPIADAAVIQVTDASGAKAEKTVVVNVADINSVVALTLIPPTNSFGYENTQTDKLLNLFMYESDDAVVRIAIEEDSKDFDSLDFDIPKIDGIFLNQITEIVNDDMDEARLSFKLPTLTQPSQRISFDYKVSDNDGNDSVTVNITVLNRPTLTWTSTGTSATFTESAGGTLGFGFSEVQGYPGDYSVALSDENGEPLDFSLPVSINEANKQITLGAAGRILGDKNVKVTLSHTYTVSNEVGEPFDVVAQTERTITIKDDRDDDFNTKVESFNQASAQLANILNRNEEDVIFRSLSTILMLDNRVTKSAITAGETAVQSALTQQKSRYTALENEIKQLISEKKTQEADAKITVYLSEVESVGSEPRQAISDWVNDNVAAADAGDVTLTLTWAPSSLIKTGDDWSHYVGNTQYGFFNTAGSEWQYKDVYAHLAAVDTDTNICE